MPRYTERAGYNYKRRDLPILLILYYYSQGVSKKAIGRLVGRSDMTVSCALRDLNIDVLR